MLEVRGARHGVTSSCMYSTYTETSDVCEADRNGYLVTDDALARGKYDRCGLGVGSRRACRSIASRSVAHVRKMATGIRMSSASIKAFSIKRHASSQVEFQHIPRFDIPVTFQITSTANTFHNTTHRTRGETRHYHKATVRGVRPQSPFKRRMHLISPSNLLPPHYYLPRSPPYYLLKPQNHRRCFHFTQVRFMGVRLRGFTVVHCLIYSARPPRIRQSKERPCIFL